MKTYDIINLPQFYSFKYDINKNYYVTTSKLITKLSWVELPIKNRAIAIKSILNFIRYFINNMDDNLFLNVGSKKTIEIFGREKYNNYLDLLNELEIIKMVPNTDGSIYVSPYNALAKGISATTKRFKLISSFYNDTELAIVYFKEPFVKQKINNEIKDLNKRYLKTIEEISLDVQGAFNAEFEIFKVNQNHQKFLSRVNRIFAFENEQRFIKYGTKTNRIYNPISNLSRESRKFVSVKNQLFHYVDIPTAQPVLLLTYFKNNGFEFDNNYEADVLNGSFYDNFLNKHYDILIKEETSKGIFKIVRNDKQYFITDKMEVKKEIYRTIFFTFNSKSDMNKEFKNQYPITWESLNNFSNNYEVELASILQNMEASIMNKVIPETSLYFTLFDAIYFTNILDLQKIIVDLKQEFLNNNIQLKKLEFDNKKIEI